MNVYPSFAVKNLIIYLFLRQDLSEYLSERKVDGKTVRTWYHRQFSEAAEEHLLSDVTHRCNMHANLAHLFLQTSGVRRTIVLRQRTDLRIEDADRRVTPQVLTRQNLRKLNALPFHLQQSRDPEALKRNCLLNFRFLFTKLQAVGVTSLFSEFCDLVTGALASDVAVTSVTGFLEMTFDALNLDTHVFPYLLQDRLGGIDDVIRDDVMLKMIRDARRWLEAAPVDVLIPRNPLNLPDLDSPIKFTQQLGWAGEVAPNEEVVVCRWKESNSRHTKIIVFDLVSREQVATVERDKTSPCVVSKDSLHFAIIANDKLAVYELHTGDLVRSVTLFDRQYDHVTIKCMDLSPDGRYLVLVFKLGKPSGTKEGEVWKTRAEICCVDWSSIFSDSDVSMVMTSYSTKRHIEQVVFIDDAKKFVAFKRDHVTVYELPTLQEVYTFQIKRGILSSAHALQVRESDVGSDVILCPVVLAETGVSVMMYDCAANNAEFSEIVNTEKTGDVSDGVVAFGLVASPDASRVLLGTNTTGSTRRTRMWLWLAGARGEARRFVLSDDVFRIATCLTLLDDWAHVVVAYQTGDVTVVSLESGNELADIHAHGNIINVCRLYNDHNNLLTMSSDHNLKLWQVDKLMRMRKTVTSSADQQVRLDLSEQVLDCDVTGSHIVTASQLTTEGPKFWSYSDGCSDVALTQQHRGKWCSILEDVTQLRGPRYHGTVEIIGDYVIYQRKKRNGFFMYITHLHDLGAPVAHEYFEDSFFSFCDPGLCEGRPLVFVVRDGILEKRALVDLKLLSSCEIPKISDTFQNLESKSAKRRLIYYKIGLTLDGKHFLICNPSPSSVVGKYIDWVDAGSMTYKQRLTLPPSTAWKFLEDSVCYFVTSQRVEMGEEGVDSEVVVEDGYFFRPSEMSQYFVMTSRSSDDVKVARCPIYPGAQFRGLLSPDHTLGLELTRGFKIRVWNLENIRKMTSLRGHTNDITCTAMSRDNSLLTSASTDNSVRLWSPATGTCLCSFHLYGNVSAVRLSPEDRRRFSKSLACLRRVPPNLCVRSCLPRLALRNTP